MVFSSLTFLYFFLPLAVVFYFLVKKRVYRNSILLVFSLLFYSWGEPKYVILMIVSSLIAYLGGILIDKFDCDQKPKYKKTMLITTIVLLVAILFVFKYLNFIVDNINLLFHGNISIKTFVLPIGISFYTFQILSYVIDLYRKEITVQKNFFYLTLYISFFPQLIAGPIVRYQTIEDEINNRHESWDDVITGMKRFIIGLAKKVLIANNVAIIATIVYEGNAAVYGSIMYWIAAIAYMLQIYFDFSGYSDMAIGLGRIFGFHFLENFNYPYVSLSITEFWRRWHISLSSWFRDYIYIPLGGNRTKKTRWMLNIVIVWGLTGLWHGAEWNFVIWGLYYAVLLLLEKLLLADILKKLPKILSWMYAMFFVIIGWVIFNSTGFHQMGYNLQKMFSFQATDWIGVISANASILNGLIYLPLGLLCMLPIANKIKIENTLVGTILSNFFYFALLGLSIMFILSTSYNPFIYFRF